MFEKFKNYFQKPAMSMDYKLVPVGQGRRVTVDANGDIAYATCIDILAKNVAMTKWSIYGADNKEISTSMQLLNKALNVQPYHAINAYSFWYYVEQQRLANGNGIGYLKFDQIGQLECIAPLDSSNVTVYWDDANILEGKRKFFYEYREAHTGRTYTILPEEIFHVKANSTNGIVGRPSIQVLMDTLRSNAEASSGLRTSVANNFSGTIVLSYSSDLNLQRRKEIQNQVKDLLNNSDATILPLPVGMEAKSIPNNAQENFKLLREANIEAISSFFGVPLAMLNVGSGTGAGVFSTNQMTQWRTLTITPIIKMYADELTIKLLTNRQINKGLHFDTSDDTFDYLDPQAKASVLSAYTGAGILTPNEARASLLYPYSDDPMADTLTQRGGTGALGDNAQDEGGNEEGEE